MCLTHIKKFTYSCINCESHACSSCVLSSSEVLINLCQHRNHRFIFYNEKRENFKANNGQIRAQISNKINEINKLIIGC